MQETVQTESSELFKECGCCQFAWRSLDHFIDDPDIEFIGYQVNFDQLELGFLLFHHKECGTSLALRVEAFSAMYDGPVFKQKVLGGDECPGHCLKKDCFDTCAAKCECAYVREIISMIRQRQN